ncbi:MAG: M48 family metallopeptidase [Candidatus Cyclobacteriaceae bacterium M2_1C_046]
MIRKIFTLLLSGIIITAGLQLYSCKTVPVSDRTQLSVVPDEQILPMSYEQYQEILNEHQLSNNEQWTSMVRTVGHDIKNAVQEYMREQGEMDRIDGYQWEFNLLQGDEVNAFAMPGGKIAFFEGIMPIAEDKTGVAVIMAHEIAHAVAHHANERMSQGLVANMGLQTLGAALGQNPSMTEQLLMQAAGFTTQLGMLKYSRTHESEADELGLIFMAKAGYNPREAVDFWQRMQAESSGQRPPEFLSTHPHPDERIQDLKEMMPRALEYYRED